MTVATACRWLAAAVGLILVMAAWDSVVVTLIVARPVRNRLTRWVDRAVRAVLILATRGITDYRRRDGVLAGHAAAILLTQLAAWMAVAFAGFWLLMWPLVPGGLGGAFLAAGSSLFTLGYSEPAGALPAAVVFAAAATGLVIITLQIAYLPTLYAAFNRRETEIALLGARAGLPAWGPELLARTHYALASGTSTLHTLPELYGQWERWAADVAESHSAYLPLVRFRSPRPLASWATALLAVLDSAALILAVAPSRAPAVPARLCLRGGFLCFNQVASAMGIEVPEEIDPADPVAALSLTYDDFLAGVERLREVDFPIERDPVDAWPDFAGWRVNYERAAYAIAAEVDAVPALWSGPRRGGGPSIPPLRPARGRLQKPT